MCDSGNHTEIVMGAVTYELQRVFRKEKKARDLVLDRMLAHSQNRTFDGALPTDL